MFSDNSSTTSSSINEAPDFISIPWVDSSSDSHSEKNLSLPPPAPRCFDSNFSEDDPEEMFQGYRGQLKLSICINGGLLTVHVISGQNFISVTRNPCNTYVKVSLTPDSSRKTRCKTDVIRGSNCPVFDEKFSFEMIEEDLTKRIFISVWHRDNIRHECEFLGCLSFSVRNIFKRNRKVYGWYYLLIGDVGRRRHLRVQECRGVRREDTYLQTLSVPIWRGAGGGFGFSISGSGMVQVCRVNPFAVALGLRLNDVIVRIDGQNVKGLSTDAVAKIIRNIPNSAVLEVQRPEVMKSTQPDSICGRMSQRSRPGSTRHKPDELRSIVRSDRSTTQFNYGWLDGMNGDLRCSSSSCGSNSSSLDVLAQMDQSEVSKEIESSQQKLETVVENETLELEDVTDEEEEDDGDKKEEGDECEDDEDCDDYMDSFKDDVSETEVSHSSQAQAEVIAPSVNEDKENRFCAGANLPRRNSLKFLNLDEHNSDFYSLPRSFSKSTDRTGEKAAISINRVAENQLVSSSTDLKIHDFRNSETNLPPPPNAKGVFRRSASLRCAIFPKLSKLKTVFKQKN